MKRSSEPSSARWMTTGECSRLSAPMYVRPNCVRHLVVELDRPHLPASAEDVRHVEVDLRAVERPLARRDDVLQAVPLQRGFERGLRVIPLLVGAEPVLRARRELGARRDAEAVVEVVDEVDHRVDLVLDLVLRDEDVRVVLGDVLHAQQAVQRPAALVAMERRGLRVADRQVAVRPRAASRRGACGRGSSSASARAAPRPRAAGRRTCSPGSCRSGPT